MIIGPMFAGKTTEMLCIMSRYHITKRSCIMVKYAGDNRYDQNVIIAHNQYEFIYGELKKKKKLS